MPHRLWIFLVVVGLLVSCGTPEHTSTGMSDSTQTQAAVPIPSNFSSTVASVPSPTIVSTSESLLDHSTSAPSPHLLLSPSPTPVHAPLVRTIAPPYATEPLTRFLAARGDMDPVTGSFTNTLVWVDLRSGTETVMAYLPKEGPPPTGRISPDHRYVVYTQYVQLGDKVHLYLYNIHTATYTLLSEQPIRSLSHLKMAFFWSPDSRYLAYVAVADDQKFTLWVYDTTIQQSQQLFHDLPFLLHGWLDHTTILFSHFHSHQEGTTLWTIDIDDKTTNLVNSYGAEITNLHHLLSPNKRWLFVSYQSLPSNIWYSSVYDLRHNAWIKSVEPQSYNVLWTADSQLVEYPLNLQPQLLSWNLQHSVLNEPLTIGTPPHNLEAITEAHSSPDGHWLLFIGNPPHTERFVDWYEYGVYHVETNTWHELNQDQTYFLYNFFGW